MKESILTDLDGFYKEPVLVDDAENGVFEIYETTQEYDAEGNPLEPTTALVGYRVSVPVPEGFYKPRYVTHVETVTRDVVTSVTNADGTTTETTSQVTENVTVGEWVEGLSQTEIDTIKNAPVPKSEVQLLQEDNAQLNVQNIELWETVINQDERLTQVDKDTNTQIIDLFEQLMDKGVL